MLTDIGIIGLGVMGRSLALNIADKGFSISVYNRTSEVTREFLELASKQHSKLSGYFAIEEFISSISAPRKVLIMVKAGKPVDLVIDSILPYLEKGDVIIDGGNSFFKDTERRIQSCKEKGIEYLGMGVSGGEKGALLGPSIMPGGSAKGYELSKEILGKIAARSDSGPCVEYIGQRGAGHFVKMVHNGIEYGNMEAIAEGYFLLKNLLGYSNEKITEEFSRWNHGRLQSFLVEISAHILKEKDKLGNGDLIDKILDIATQKGTGRWTVETAFELGVAVPVINAALNSRIISARKEDRVKNSGIFSNSLRDNIEKEKGRINSKDIEKAVLCSILTSFSQGFELIKTASMEYNYAIKLSDIAKIWKAGCIIRSNLLDNMAKVFSTEAERELIFSYDFKVIIEECLESWAKVVSISAITGHYIPVLSAGLNYIMGLSSSRLQANLIQGQRDYFGAHTYQRIDRQGVFHTEWD